MSLLPFTDILLLIFLLDFPCFYCSDIHHVCAKNNKTKKMRFEGKIVGGEPVPLEKYPYSVQFFNFGALCSGSILNSWSVLTAAHCFDHNKEVEDMTIHVGARYTYASNAEVYNVGFFIRHEEYNKTMMFACDIAIIFVTEPIRFTSRAKKALLVNSTNWMSGNSADFEATGWGWTKYGGHISKHGLMMAHLRYIPARRCGQQHGLELSPDMFCLYGDGFQDSCKGDSGGGVLWNGFLVGIVSHGDGCARKNKPSVYSNVYYFRKWIHDTIDQFLVKYCSTFKHGNWDFTNEEQS